MWMPPVQCFPFQGRATVCNLMCSDHEYADCVTQCGIRDHDIYEALLGSGPRVCVFVL